MKTVKQVVAVLVWCMASVGCAAKQPDLLKSADENQKSKNEDIIFQSKKIVEIRYVGALCMVGDCNQSIIIYENGDTANIINSKIYSYNKLTENDLKLLILDIDEESLKNLKQKSRDDYCPTMSDSPEKIFIFYREEKIESISECEYELKESNKLFRNLSELIKKYHNGHSIF